MAHARRTARDEDSCQAVMPDGSPPELELLFTKADFERIRRHIHRFAGISLNSNKQQMVYSRLGRRLRTLGIGSFREYMDLVESGANAGEHRAFVNALTTNLTSFFREPYHFPVLSEHLRQVARDHPPVIWCAAASTGEEPYSIAITAMQALGREAARVRIVASDIDTDVLARATRGIYPVEALDRLPGQVRESFFLRGVGANAGLVQIKAEVRKLVTFQQLNLLSGEWPVHGQLDAIFCRNVMIYFDKLTQRTIIERFSRLIRPDGLLFVGHAESLAQSSHLFQLRGRTVYSPCAVQRIKPADTR